jgi:hypothetical protein
MGASTAYTLALSWHAVTSKAIERTTVKAWLRLVLGNRTRQCEVRIVDISLDNPTAALKRFLSIEVGTSSLPARQDAVGVDIACCLGMDWRSGITLHGAPAIL